MINKVELNLQYMWDVKGGIIGDHFSCSFRRWKQCKATCSVVVGCSCTVTRTCLGVRGAAHVVPWVRGWQPMFCREPAGCLVRISHVHSVVLQGKVLLHLRGPVSIVLRHQSKLLLGFESQLERSGLCLGSEVWDISTAFSEPQLSSWLVLKSDGFK